MTQTSNSHAALQQLLLQQQQLQYAHVQRPAGAGHTSAGYQQVPQQACKVLPASSSLGLDSGSRNAHIHDRNGAVATIPGSLVFKFGCYGAAHELGHNAYSGGGEAGGGQYAPPRHHASPPQSGGTSVAFGHERDLPGTAVYRRNRRKATLKMVLVSVILVSFLCNFDHGVIPAILSEIQKNFNNQIKFVEQSLFGSLVYFGLIIGSLFAGKRSSTSAISRRTCLYVNCNVKLAHDVAQA